MASDLNRVTLVGRLTRDPEIRTTAGGTDVANIRLAFTSRRKDNTGAWVDQSNYIDVVVFGAQAASAGQYLSKGRKIGTDGRLSWREWTQQDGSKRQSIEVIADSIFYLDSNQDSNGNGSTSTDDLAPATPVAAGSPGPDDAPF
jgi:single-strand DNA-binding protein